MSPLRLLAVLAVLLGQVVLVAGPAQAATGRVAWSTATLAPGISATPSSGPAGTATVLAGRGFAARQSGSVTVGTAVHAVRTDGRGSFTLSTTVAAPGTGSGPVVITARVGTRSASTTFSVTAAQPRLRFGVTTPGGPAAAAELDAVAAQVGEQPAIVLSYADFTRELDVAGLEAVAARRAVPLVTWEPWVAGRGVDQPAYALDRITAGDFDPYLRRWAEGLRAFGRPVMLRFAHEMNGGWYPWAEGVNGNGAGDYAAAWRHVRAVVRGAGATNVSWVWSPNVPYPGSTPLAGLYPGAAEVDVVALDGYNFGTAMSWSTWTAPAQLFGPGLSALRSLAPGKPVVVAETASAEVGGSKAAWVADLVAYLAGQPDVTGLVWFDHLKETDWRIASSPESARAFATALAARRAA